MSISKSICETEELIQQFLESLRNPSSSTKSEGALDFLAPRGFRPVVQLQKAGGRRKRRTASASSWDPEWDEMVITFDAVKNEAEPKGSGSLPQREPNSMPPLKAEPIPNFPQEVFPVHVQQLCDALEAAEGAGRSFIALRWFRDEALPARGYSWTTDASFRQTVLAEAISKGVVLTGRIPNPKLPSHPTTTIKLNRNSTQNGQNSRFSPVPIRGTSLSRTISHERGAR